MSDKLYSIVSFTGIAIGGTATLPHGLTVGGPGPVKPDLVFLQFSSSFEIVSATTTNLTIRNTADVAGDCQAFCHAIHPVERSFGLSPDDGTFSQHLTPQPFCPGSPNGSGTGTSSFDVVVFRPGGVASENVVTTWANALTLLAAQQGTRRLEFDDTNVTPISIPVGAHDMTGVTWASVPDRQSRVLVVEGTTFLNLRSFDRVAVEFSGTTPPVNDFVNAAPQIDTVSITNDASFVVSGAGPFFLVGADAQFILGPESGFFSGTFAVLDIDVGGNTVTIVQEGPQSAVSDNTIRGLEGSVLNHVVADSAPSAASTLQGLFTGDLNFTNVTQDRTFPTTVITAFTTLTTTSQLVLVIPTGGAFAFTLPPAAGNEGLSITVKNASASANNVTITAGVGDNIDGAATLVKGVAHFAVRLTSDGVHAWYVTASA